MNLSLSSKAKRKNHGAYEERGCRSEEGWGSWGFKKASLYRKRADGDLGLMGSGPT